MQKIDPGHKNRRTGVALCVNLYSSYAGTCCMVLVGTWSRNPWMFRWLREWRQDTIQFFGPFDPVSPPIALVIGSYIRFCIGRLLCSIHLPRAPHQYACI
jgi:hypothetical protein